MVSRYLSPYLRPFRKGGRVVYDNGITGAVEEIDPVEDAIVRALWNARNPAAVLDALAAAQGEQAVAQGIAGLTGRMMLFGDRSQCDLTYDAVLESGVPPVPFVEQIELTNRCVFHCRFCPRGFPGRLKRPVGLMERAVFERLLGELHPRQAQYRPLELHHLGESLLHPELDRFIATASGRGLPVELSVNPALLEPELGHRLLEAGLRRLVISLDGMDDETSTALRGPPASYERSERNLTALLEQVAGTKDPPIVIIQMLDLSRNRHQREAFLARWGTTGIATVHAVVKDLDGPDPDLGRPASQPLVFLCSFPWRSVVVLWDGRVVPCCRDDDAHLVLGDLKGQTLTDIWRGPRVSELRARHRAGRLEAGHLCHGCAWRRERFAAAMPLRHPDRAKENPWEW